MNRGRRTCDQLKALRKQIADANDIELEQNECTFEGECLGTCPKCDSELRYLERELYKRRLSGKKLAIVGMASLALIGGTTACDDDEGDIAGPIERPTEEEPIEDYETEGAPITSCYIILKEEKVTLCIGQQYQIEVEEASHYPVSWTSDNEEVATVDDDGMIMAKEAGIAEIEVRCGYARKVVVVTVHYDYIELKDKEITMTTGEQYTIGIKEDRIIEPDEFVSTDYHDIIWTVKDGEALPTKYTVSENFHPVLWTSSNEEVATVDANGTVTAQGAGQADIKVEYGSDSRLVAVTVLEKAD